MLVQTQPGSQLHEGPEFVMEVKNLDEQRRVFQGRGCQMSPRLQSSKPTPRILQGITGFLKTRTISYDLSFSCLLWKQNRKEVQRKDCH
jgi:hypothetical protein